MFKLLAEAIKIRPEAVAGEQSVSSGAGQTNKNLLELYLNSW